MAKEKQVRKKVPRSASLGKRIIASRARMGISQQELGKRAGVNPSTMSRMERGIGEPSVFTLERVAEALGVGTDRLLGYDLCCPYCGQREDTDEPS